MWFTSTAYRPRRLDAGEVTSAWTDSVAILPLILPASLVRIAFDCCCTSMKGLLVAEISISAPVTTSARAPSARFGD